MKFVKYLLSFVLVLGAAYYVLVNLSAVESRYKCTGERYFSGGKEPIEIFIILEDYRWRVGLWSDSEGYLYIEIPNEQVGVFHYLEEVGEQLHIYRMFGDELAGNYSALSKTLILQIGSWQFEGQCVEID